MQAWTQPILWVLALTVLFLVHSTAAAPLSEQTTEIEYYPVADSTGCYYNFQHYDEGDRIITNEPCLNCTCHNRMLMCYLRVCPFTKAIGQDCTVEKRPDQCCPVITCPEVPVQLLTSTTTESSKSTEVGHPDTYGCSIDNLFYSDGARVPSHPNKPCELCYCIRNKTACVMQECTLKIEGCKPVYQEGVCCPVKYDCEYPEDALLETTVRPTPSVILTTTTLAPGPVDCVYNNEIYADGALVKKDIPCEHCYCMKGDIVCAVQECGPTPLEKVNCTALPPREGQCCPDTYDCENAIEEISTEGYEYSTTPVVHPVVSEEEASSAAPSPAVTQQPLEAATINDIPAVTEQPAEQVTSKQEEAESPTSSSLPERTEAGEEPIAFATTQLPIRETQPKKEDEGYLYPKPASPGLEITPLGETTTASELGEITTVIPEEISKQKIPPSGEQVTERIPSVEKEKAEETTSPSPSLEDREKERPEELQTGAPSTDAPKEEESSSRITTPQVEEQTTLASVTKTAEEETTAGTALPTIQPSELPEEGAANTTQEISELTTAKPEIEKAQSTEEIVEVTTELSSEEKISSTEKETVVPGEGVEVTTAQISREPATTLSSAQSPEPELTTLSTSEELTESASEAAVTVPQETSRTTQKPSLPELTTVREETSEEVETELPHAAATVSGAHVTAEPESSSEDIEPSHDQVPAEGEEEEEEGSGTPTEEPVSITEQSKGAETTTSPAIVTERTGGVATAEVEQNAPTSPVTESGVESASTAIEERVTTEISTSEYAKPEPETEVSSQESATTQQPTVVESETQQAQETKVPIIPESATSPSVTEEPFVGSTVREQVTEAAAPENLIPGEGSCLVDGQTYSNNSSIPPINQCQVSCKCVSSIVQCESISCSPPPSNADNCTPVFEGPNTCCPTYSCTAPSETEIESDSHKMQEASTVFEELTTTAVSLEKYTTEEPKEAVSQEATTASSAEEGTTPEVTEKAEAEATTASHIFEEIQTTEKSVASETTARQQEPEVQTTETVPATEAVEENEIPIEVVKETEAPRDATTTAIPERLSSTESAATTAAVEAETSVEGLTTAKLAEVTPPIEEKSETVSPPLLQTEVSSVETQQPTATEKLETVTEISQATTKQINEAATSSTSEGTTPSRDEGVTLGESVSSSSVPSKEIESEVTSAVAVTTEEVMEHVTEIIPAKEMGKPESHVTESARKPTSEVAVSEPVTTEQSLSSSSVPQQGCAPGAGGCISAPSEVPEEDHTPGLIAHDIEVAEEEEEGEEEETEKSVTEVSKESQSTTESIKEVSSSQTPKEAVATEGATEAAVTEIPKEIITDEAAAAPTEPAKETEAVKDVTVPAVVEEVSSTQPPKAVTPENVISTEPSEEVTTPETIISTESVKEALSTEAPKEVEAEGAKETSTEPFAEVATTEAGVAETTPSKPVEPVEIETTEAVHTELPQEETSSEVSSTETIKEALPTELPESASPEAPTEVKTERAPQEVTTEIIAEVTTVIEVEDHTEEQATTVVPIISQKPADEDQVAQDHVTAEEVETVAPETERPAAEVAVPITTEGIKEEVESVTSMEITSSAPYETTAPSVEEIATTTKDEEELPSATDSSIKEEVPEVTERLQEITTAAAEVTEVPTASPATTKSEEEKEEEVEKVSEPAISVDTLKPEEISTIYPQETETTQPQTTSAVIYNETSKPEEVTTASSVSEQPRLPEEGVAAQTTVSPVNEAQTVSSQSSTEAASELGTGIVTEPVEAQTAATAELETTVSPAAGVTESDTSKPYEIVTSPAEEFTTSPSGISSSSPEENVTSEETTGGIEELTTPREQEPVRTETEADTEVSKVEITTPLSKVETTEAVSATTTSAPKQPIEPETAETHVPETSEETDVKEVVTTVQPLSEVVTDEVPRKPVVSSEASELTTASQTESEIAEVATTETSKKESPAVEVTTLKEQYNTTSAPAEVTKSEEATLSVTSRPEIPGESLAAQEPAAEKDEVPELDSAVATTLGYENSSPYTEGKYNLSTTSKIPISSTPASSSETPRPSFFTSPISTETPTTSPSSNEVPEIPDYTSSTEEDYPEEEDQGTFGPGTCRYGGKLYMSAQQIPRDDPCDFCFCFRSDIICLQQSCPPPIPHCHEEPIRGFCCPRYECPVSMATTLNLTTTSTTTTTTLPPHFLAHAYSGRATRQGCQIQGQAYQVGDVIKSASGPCLHCTCGGDGQMKCDPKACSPEPMLRQMIAAAASRRRR